MGGIGISNIFPSSQVGLAFPTKSKLDQSRRAPPAGGRSAGEESAGGREHDSFHSSSQVCGWDSRRRFGLVSAGEESAGGREDDSFQNGAWLDEEEDFFENPMFPRSSSTKRDDSSSCSAGRDTNRTPPGELSSTRGGRMSGREPRLIIAHCSPRDYRNV